MTAVLIRLRADLAVGRGHLARCLPLARALVAAGAAVELALETDGPWIPKPEPGLSVALAPSWPFERLLEEAAGHDVVVVDLHDLPTADAEALREVAPVVALSAVGTGIAAVDLLVNPVADQALQSLGLPTGTGRPQVRSGPDGVIVDELRLGPLRGAVHQSGTVLVTLGGGSGHAAAIEELVAELDAHPAVERVLVAPGATVPRFVGAATVLPGPDDLAPALATAGLVICGLGTTLYEAAFLGTPAVVLPGTGVHAQQARWLAPYGFHRVAEGGPAAAAAVCADVLATSGDASLMSAAGMRFAQPGGLAAIAAAALQLAPGGAPML